MLAIIYHIFIFFPFLGKVKYSQKINSGALKFLVAMAVLILGISFEFQQVS